MPFDAPSSPRMKGRMVRAKIERGRAIRSATTTSGRTIAKIFGTCSPTVMCTAVIIT